MRVLAPIVTLKSFRWQENFQLGLSILLVPVHSRGISMHLYCTLKERCRMYSDLSILKTPQYERLLLCDGEEEEEILYVHTATNGLS